MAVLPLVKAPDPRLARPSEPVTGVDDDLRAFLADMVDTMYAANGIGLAAIQVGVPKRVVVIDLDPKGPDSKVLYLLNPELVEASGEQAVTNEGCLSVPDYWDDVSRAAKVTVKYRDENWQEQQVEAEGLFAICLQHEIDHINGYLFIDHLSKLKRNIALRKSAKLKRLKDSG
jgi:peptide deformylase